MNKNNQVTVSAPAKIHLMGEHFIVYGKPAILTTINKRLKVTVSQNKVFKIDSAQNPYLIKQAVKVVNKRLGINKLPQVKIKIESEIPVGYHIGSSAAVSVAIVSALLFFLKKIWNLKVINELSYEVEKYQHKNASGGDNTVITYGGLIWYRKELEFLKSIWQLPFSLSKKFAPFFLIDTGKPQENTGEMVLNVSQFVKNNKKLAEELFLENEQAVKQIAIALKQGQEKQLISAIKKGERTLEKLRVVSTKIIPLIRQIESLGAVKILGGGGKKGAVGFLLCYSRKRKQVEEIVKRHNYRIDNISLSTEGVKLE